LEQPQKYGQLTVFKDFYQLFTDEDKTNLKDMEDYFKEHQEAIN